MRLQLKPRDFLPRRYVPCRPVKDADGPPVTLDEVVTKGQATGLDQQPSSEVEPRPPSDRSHDPGFVGAVQKAMQARQGMQLVVPLSPRGGDVGCVSNASIIGVAVVDASINPLVQGVPSVLETSTPAQGKALGESDESKAVSTDNVST